MQKYVYNDSLGVSRIKKFYFAILAKLARSCIFPQIRLLIYRLMGIKIGRDVYISLNLDIIDYSLGKFLTIGDRCAISSNVTFLISSSPNNSKLIKLYPRIYGPINVEEDVWIGTKAVIFPGVTIGKCSIIGSGSIVNKDIPPYSVAAGNPVAILKKLDPTEL